MFLAHSTSSAQPWDWHAHPDVWLLMAGLALGYLAALRWWAPVGASEPSASTAQKFSFFAGVTVLWVAADWPIHEWSEEYLFSVHMVQHTAFSLVAAPLLLLGIPKWLLRKLLSPAPVFKAARFITRPVVALLLFNAIIAVTHWPALVNLSLRSEPAHFLLHVVLMGGSLAMWWPVVSPLPEMPSLTPPAKMFYLFLQSILPTVPASFLTFSSEPLYEFYAAAPRLWGISAVTDQRIAGLFMKIGGGLLLWAVIAFIFFKWNAQEQSDRPDEVAWDDFERELEVWNLRK